MAIKKTKVIWKGKINGIETLKRRHSLEIIATFLGVWILVTSDMNIAGYS